MTLKSGSGVSPLGNYDSGISPLDGMAAAKRRCHFI